MRIGLFIPCYVDAFFPEVGVATLEIARALRPRGRLPARSNLLLLDPADIVVNIYHACARPEFRKGHYAYFHTGPSATADIEGVLIHGAQGVRSLSELPVARAGRSAPNESDRAIPQTARTPN